MEQINNQGIEIYCERCKAESRKPGFKMPFGWLRIDSKEKWGSGSPVKIYYLCPECTRIPSKDLVEFLKSLKPVIALRITMVQPFVSITLNNVVV